MAMTILDAATAAAVYASTDQDAQVAALEAAFSGTVLCKWYSGTTLLSTREYSGWTIDSISSPRGMSLATKGTRTFSSGPAAATKVVFNNGTTDIFQVTSAVGGGDISMDGNVISGAGENLDSLVINANNTLPILDVFAVLAASMSPGTWLEVTSSTNVESITDVSGPGGLAVGWLEGADPAAARGELTTWPGNATWDPVNKKVILVGCTNGYSSEAGQHSNVLKLDCSNGQFSKTWNPTGTNMGHQYDANGSQVIGGYLYRRDYVDSSGSASTFWRMNLATNVWSNLGDSNTLFGMGAAYSPSGCVFPTYGASGSFIVAGTSGKVARYDISGATGSVLAASSTNVGGPEVICEYFPGLDKVLFGGGVGGTAIYSVDTSGVVALFQSSASWPAGVTQIAPTSAVATVLVPDPQARALGWLFDPAQTGHYFQWNLSTKAWTDLGALPAGINSATCYCCVPEYSVIVALVGVNRIHSGDTTCPSKVFLFKPA